MSTGIAPAAEVASTSMSGARRRCGAPAGPPRWTSRSAARRRRRRRPRASSDGAAAVVGTTHRGSARNGAPSADGGELGRELAADHVLGAVADQAEGGGVPERGRAAVAEQRSGSRRAARSSSRRPARIRPTSCFTGGCRWLVPSSVAAGGAQRVRRPTAGTFDGPEPNRPSRGLRSAGITMRHPGDPPSADRVSAQDARRGRRCRTGGRVELVAQGDEVVEARVGRAQRRRRRGSAACPSAGGRRPTGRWPRPRGSTARGRAGGTGARRCSRTPGRRRSRARCRRRRRSAPRPGSRSARRCGPARPRSRRGRGARPRAARRTPSRGTPPAAARRTPGTSGRCSRAR